MFTKGDQDRIIGQQKAEIERLFTVHEIIKDISSKKTFDEVAVEVLNGIEKKMGYSASSLSLVDMKENTIQLKYLSESILSKVSRKLLLDSSAFIPIPLQSNNMSITSQAVIENRVIIDEDFIRFVVPPLKENVAKLIKRVGSIKAMAAVPISARGEVIGVLNFSIPRHMNQITIEEVRTVELLGSEVGLVTQNLLQYEEISNFNTKLENDIEVAIEDLKDRNLSLQSIFNISQGVSSSLDSDEVVQIAVNLIAEVDGYVGAILSLLDDNSMLKVTAFSKSEEAMKAVGMLGVDIFELAVDVKDEKNKNLITVKSVLKGEVNESSDITAITSGLVSDPIAHAVQSFLKASSYVSVPVRSQEKVVGVMTFILSGKELHDVTREDRSFMRTITQVTSTSLHNAKLYSDKEQALSELVKARQELEERYIELSRIRARERDMMDIMGHELRTPLSILKISLGALDMQADKHPEKFKVETYLGYRDRLRDAIDREVKLLETMLTSTKIDSARIELAKEKVSLKGIIDDAILSQKEKADDKKLVLNVERVDPGIEVYADKVRLGEVVDNLVSNAVKYTEEGSVSIKVNNSDPKMVSVSVADTGPGIPKEALPRLGEKFFRVGQYLDKQAGNGSLRSPEIVRPGGTGLGLYVTFGLVKLMGGKLTVNSEVGKGSVFTFTIPRYNGQKIDIEYGNKKDLFSRLGLGRDSNGALTEKNGFDIDTKVKAIEGDEVMSEVTIEDASPSEVETLPNAQSYDIITTDEENIPAKKDEEN